MSRLSCTFMVVCCLSVCPVSIGCGGGETVIEQTKSAAEMEQEDAEYAKEMEASGTGSGVDQ